MRVILYAVSAIVIPSRAMFQAVRDHRNAQAGEMAARPRRDLSKLDTQTKGFLDTIIVASDPSVIAAFEKRIEALDTEKRLIEDKLNQSPNPARTYARITLKPLENMGFRLTKQAGIGAQTSLCRSFRCDRRTGYLTPELSLPFMLLGKIPMNKKMVPLT